MRSASSDIAKTARKLERAHSSARRAVSQRLALIVGTLEPDSRKHRSVAELLHRFDSLLASARDAEVWLSLAVLAADYPETAQVLRARRTIVSEGVMEAFADYLLPTGPARWRGTADTPIEVVTGGVLVDVEHTARTELATGIQRVTRELVQRWKRAHDIQLIGWSPGYRAMRRLLPEEEARALTGRGEQAPRWKGGPAPLVVPWKSTYVLPELAPEHPRTIRMSAMARFSGNRMVAVGYDCIPISSAETADANVSEAFTGYLAALRYMDSVACISRASAQEFMGWRHMLTAIGVPGPDISAVLLPAEIGEPSEVAMAQARDRFLIGTLPLVLCVGTHEPRKNHMAVLAAARRQWEAGQRFSLMFIGGHAWASDRFYDTVKQLQHEGFPVETMSSVSDEMLWAAYKLAHCVVFPSLNEGFGLPVAEALASGTPVITSNFGSMLEIAEAGGGALLVDPRDDDSITEALGTMLSDSDTVQRLRAEAASRPSRTWDDYAAEVWSRLAVDAGGGTACLREVAAAAAQSP